MWRKPYGVVADEYARAAQQGYCWTQCFCPQLGHTSGWRAEKS